MRILTQLFLFHYNYDDGNHFHRNLQLLQPGMLRHVGKEWDNSPLNICTLGVYLMTLLMINERAYEDIFPHYIGYFRINLFENFSL